MAENSFIYTSVEDNGTYDREITADNVRLMISKIIGNGVYAADNSLQVTKADGENLTVQIGTGSAWIEGGFYNNSVALDLTLATADSAYPRYDAIVLRQSITDRKISAEIITGTPSSSPSVPSLTWTDDVQELQLCYITVAKSATYITDAEIHDTRATSTCGWVTGAIDQIDTSGLFIQFESSFDTWFADVKETLSDDAAGSLLTKINTNISDIDDLTTGADNQAHNADVIRVKMAIDYVPVGEVVPLPFSTSFYNGVTSADWGELQSDGSVKILKTGEYMIGFNFYVSDINGMTGMPFHVRTKIRSKEVTIGENYVQMDTSGGFAAGNTCNQMYLETGDIIDTHIVPPSTTRGYRISAKQTHLTVAPVRFI